MAKKADDADFKTYLQDVLATVPDDQRGTVEGILANETTAAALRNGYVRQREFSQQMDALRAERESFATEVQQARQNIAGWEDWYRGTVQEVTQVQEQLKQYRDTFGDLENLNPQGYVMSKPSLTREEVEQLADSKLASRATELFNQVMSANDMLDDLKWDHREKFGKRLDTAELLKFCNERGLPLQAGYKEYVADDLNQLRDKELQERLSKAREEGRREALSQHSLPIAPAGREPHPLDLMRDIKAPTNQFDRVSAAAASFSEAMNGK